MLTQDMQVGGRGYVWRPQVETLDRPSLERLQLRKLQRQVEVLGHRSALYRRKLAAAGLNDWSPDGLHELARLRVTTRQELVTEFEATGEPSAGRLVVALEEVENILVPASPAMDAPPIFNYLSAVDRAEQVESLVRFLRMIGARAGMVLQILAWGQEPLVALLAGGLGGTGTYSAPGAADYLGLHVVGMELAAAEAGRTVAVARLLHPAGIIASSEHLDAMRDTIAGEGQAPPDLGYGFIVVREPAPLSASETARLAALWGASVFAMLDCSEALFTAVECGLGEGLHAWEDHFIVEVTDADGGPLPGGEMGRLTLTTLTPGATPLLRYQTDVQARLDFDPCACGRTHVRVCAKVV